MKRVSSWWILAFSSCGAPAERFSYLHSEEEPQEQVPRIKELASRAQQINALFNNCYGDKAVVNAHQISSLLD